jgi:DNA modification methylase
MTNDSTAKLFLLPQNERTQIDQPLSAQITSTEQYLKPIAKERLPTNTTTYQHPFHRWFNFIAGFSPEFVHECCTEIEGGEQSVLLDPFAGCATAPLVACQKGLRAIGFEAHSVFARIGRAKLPSPNSLDEFNQIENIIREGFADPKSSDILSPAPALFLSKLFPKDSLEMLLGARQALKRNNLLENDLAFLVLSKIVDLCSHSQTDGVYKAPTSRKGALSPLAACEQVTQMIYTDLNGKTWNYNQRGSIIYSSSEDMSAVQEESISIVVTSPPYLNNFDYAEMTRMLLYFWGIATSWGDITNKVRSKLIVNTTTALKGQKEKQDDYRKSIPIEICSQLDTLVEQLREQRKIRAGKKEYDFLVYPYFSQMTSVLRECHRCMKRDAPIHLMVADAALYGIHISTPQLLQSILDNLGFRNTQCSLVRQRGHRWILAKREGSKTGLGEYHVQAVK